MPLYARYGVASVAVVEPIEHVVEAYRLEAHEWLEVVCYVGTAQAAIPPSVDADRVRPSVTGCRCFDSRWSSPAMSMPSDTVDWIGHHRRMEELLACARDNGNMSF